jgi:hypothetical protein
MNSMAKQFGRPSGSEKLVKKKEDKENQNPE